MSSSKVDESDMEVLKGRIRDVSKVYRRNSTGKACWEDKIIAHDVSRKLEWPPCINYKVYFRLYFSLFFHYSTTIKYVII